MGASWAPGAATPPTNRNVYASGTGRITRIGRELSAANPGATPLPDSTYRHYDPAGNVTWGEHKGWGTYVNGGTAINHITLTRNYYGADQKLRVDDCESTLTRFVWAGDQLLWELRVRGGNDVTTGSSGLDATSAGADFYGRVSYFHAGGIDKPLRSRRRARRAWCRARRGGASSTRARRR